MLPLDLLRRVAPYLFAILVVAGALFGAYRHGVDVTTDHFELKMSEAEAANITAINELNDKARAAEQQHAESLSAIDKQHQEQLTNEINSRDSVIAGLRIGAVQLRQRFTCPAGGAGLRLPATATGSSVGNAGAAGGLQQQDVEFFIREASRADEVVMQLQACQGVVRDDRAGR